MPGSLSLWQPTTRPLLAPAIRVRSREDPAGSPARFARVGLVRRLLHVPASAKATCGGPTTRSSNHGTSRSARSAAELALGSLGRRPHATDDRLALHPRA